MSKQTAHRDLIALPVAEFTSHPVLSVIANVMLGDVLSAMVGTGLRHLAVVNDADRCVGVVGDRAVAAAWAADPTALDRLDPAGCVAAPIITSTGTNSTPTAWSSPPASCRQPRRTRAPSRTTCAASSSPGSTSTTTGSPTSASRRSATTTRASPARPTSSI